MTSRKETPYTLDIDFGPYGHGLEYRSHYMTHVFRTSGPTAESDVPEGLKREQLNAGGLSRSHAIGDWGHDMGRIKEIFAVDISIRS